MVHMTPLELRMALASLERDVAEARRTGTKSWRGRWLSVLGVIGLAGLLL